MERFLCEECPSSSSIWWRDLRKVCCAKSESKWFEKFIEWKVGDGEKTNFLFDNWVGDQLLGISFPRLFLNSNKKNDMVANMGGWEGLTWRWKFEWHREWFEREMEQVNFGGLVQNEILDRGEGD